jgi:hypothetical protein
VADGATVADETVKDEPEGPDEAAEGLAETLTEMPTEIPTEGPYDWPAEEDRPDVYIPEEVPSADEEGPAGEEGPAELDTASGRVLEGTPGVTIGGADGKEVE